MYLMFIYICNDQHSSVVWIIALSLGQIIPKKWWWWWPVVVNTEQIFISMCFNMSPYYCCRWCRVKSSAFVYFAAEWVFKCLLKLPDQTVANSQWLHLSVFSPEWIFKCLTKSPPWTDAKSHWLHLCCFSPEWIFKCLFKSPASRDA